MPGHGNCGATAMAACVDTGARVSGADAGITPGRYAAPAMATSTTSRHAAARGVARFERVTGTIAQSARNHV